jgi:hypothetical protein
MKFNVWQINFHQKRFLLKTFSFNWSGFIAVCYFRRLIGMAGMISDQNAFKMYETI